MGLSYDHSFISFFLLVYGRTILVLQFFLSIYPSSYSILILWFFFPKKLFWFWIMKKRFWLDRRKKYIPTWHFHSIIIYLPFSQCNHIQNFEEKQLFQHFANLINIRSTHLLPILDLIIPPLPEGGGGILFYLCPSVLPKHFSPLNKFYYQYRDLTVSSDSTVMNFVKSSSRFHQQNQIKLRCCKILLLLIILGHGYWCSSPLSIFIQLTRDYLA